MSYAVSTTENEELYTFVMDETTEKGVGQTIYHEGAEIGYVSIRFPTPEEPLGNYDVELVPTHESHRKALYEWAMGELAYLIYERDYKEEMITEWE
jgi:hypothetical protein